MVLGKADEPISYTSALYMHSLGLIVCGSLHLVASKWIQTYYWPWLKQIARLEVSNEIL